MLQTWIENFRPGNPQEEADRAIMLDALQSMPTPLLRENRIAHFTASSWIVNPERTKVLLVWHNIYRHWSWTGGHADGEENLLEVALREAREETGLANVRAVDEAPVSLEMLSVFSHYRRGAYVSAHLHMNLTWLLEADETEALTVKPDENSGVKWFAIEDVLSAANEPEMLPVYDKLNGRIARYPKGMKP